MSLRSHLGRFLIGTAAGITLGYTAVRAYEMWSDHRTPAPAQERDAKRYGRVRRTLTVVDLVRSLAGVGLWAFGAGEGLERLLAPLPRPLRLPAAAGLIVATDALREWPIDYLEGYVTERIFGNSERSERAWAEDRLKGLAVGFGVTLVLALGVDTLVARAPRRWPLVAIACTPPLLAFANVIAPTFVLPLFNQYVRLTGPLEEKIRRLATRYGVGNATILRFDMSRQTKKANAFVTGVFGTERIAIADTLLDEFAEDETLFVVAHELGHYVRRDPWNAVALGTALLGGSLVFANTVVRRTAGERYGVAAMLQLAFYLVLAQLLTMPLANAFSRLIERRADRFAVDATDDPASGARAFRRLRDQNLAEDEAPRWAELLFSSHPSLKSRIETLEAIASK